MNEIDSILSHVLGYYEDARREWSRADRHPLEFAWRLLALLRGEQPPFVV
jgi:hypothetical protein